MAKDIAAQAEQVIQKLCGQDRNGKTVINLKTNQIRKFLTAVNTVTGKIEVYRAKHDLTDQLPDDLAAEVKYLKIKIAYQAGREKAVKDFVNKAEMIKWIDSIGNSIEKYEEFAKYVEALVAYHKYYGGKD